MAVSPEYNKCIYSRIAFELAAAIKYADNNKLHIDDALIVAATPTVLLNYKAIEDKDLKHIMMHMKLFFKRNPRFLDFTKAAVAHGLREEWLPTLEDSEKCELLADFTLTPAVDEDGFVIFNPTVFANLTKCEHPDHESYGKGEYTPRPARKSATKRGKVLLTSATPDSKLAEKLAPYIAWYKQNWSQLHTLEDYKWKAIRHFQETFDLDAEDLAANLKESFKYETNLLSGPMYMPLSMLLKNARLSHDDVRQALVNLYDESKPLAERSETFLDEFAAINQRNKEAGNIREKENDMQSDRATSVYLAFRYPDKHYIFKTSVWNNFKDEVELDYPPLSHFVGKLYGYELMADQIREVLMADSELMSLLKADEPDDDYNGYLLTQDFMYAVAVHLLNINDNN